jgi:integrase
MLYGLRRGEVLGLSWADVDFDQDVIHIRQQLIRAGHQLQLGPVKTAAGHRKLPLLGIAREALLTQAAAKSGSSGNSWAQHELVFVTRTGNAIEPRNLARSFERITGRAGLRPIRLHDLRHTTATLLKGRRVASDASFPGKREDAAVRDARIRPAV